MGGGIQAEKRKEMIEIIEMFRFQNGYTVTEREFTSQIFKSLDSKRDHAKGGPILVSDTYVLKAFHDHLFQQTNSPVTKARLIEVIQKIYDKPEKSIQYSYRIIKANTANISRQQFTDFIKKCFEKGLESIQRLNKSDPIFKKSFKDWVDFNKQKIMTGINDLFTGYSHNGDKDIWTVGDFKRWILTGDQWMICVQIKEDVYKIPLNIPCLFGVKIEIPKSQ